MDCRRDEFLFAIIAKVRDEGTRLMRFDTDELRNLASKDFHLERWSQTMKSVADKVVDLKYYERTEHSYAVMNLFSYFRVDEKERIVEVEVSSKFEYVINKLEAQFTQYELAEFTNIRSTYAKTAYRLFKQWRIKGKRDFMIAEFRTLLDMPDYYKPSEIDRLVLKPILSQLSPYFQNLKVKKSSQTSVETLFWGTSSLGILKHPNRMFQINLTSKNISRKDSPTYLGGQILIT